ncbi:hypothetical protein HanLR1_Chr15g0587351 [Helianthus annuus]|nr:hypothetical protein HanLR1_Chr15g0587351 [Helianthus annuus]
MLVLWLTVNDGGLLWLSERRCRWCPPMPVVPVDAGGARRCRWCPSMPVVSVDAGGARRCRWCPSMLVPVDAGGAAVPGGAVFLDYEGLMNTVDFCFDYICWI